MLRTLVGMLFLLPATAAAADIVVTGAVTVQGQPLATGKVVFHLDNGQFVGSAVKNGTYTVSRVPAGTQRVTVEGEGVPTRYTRADVTPLTVELKGAAAELNFALMK